MYDKLSVNTRHYALLDISQRLDLITTFTSAQEDGGHRLSRPLSCPIGGIIRPRLVQNNTEDESCLKSCSYMSLMNPWWKKITYVLGKDTKR